MIRDENEKNLGFCFCEDDMKKLERFTFRLSLEDLKLLNILASEFRRARSDVVRWLIKEKYLSVIAIKKEGTEDFRIDLQKEKNERHP
jgi:hypothetical protein